MPRDNASILAAAFLVTVSVFGLATIAVIAFRSTPSDEPTIWRKPIIGSTFVALCLLGIAAATSPSRCSRLHILHPTDLHSKSIDARSEEAFRGHHPNCRRFADHVVHLHGAYLCAACTGLLSGALVAVAGTVLFLFIRLELGFMPSAAMVLGMIGVALGLVQFMFKGHVRIIANALFVIGAFLILVAVDSAAENVHFDVYTLGLIVTLLLARITLSKWNNGRICGSCGNCEVLEGRSILSAAIDRAYDDECTEEHYDDGPPRNSEA